VVPEAPWAVLLPLSALLGLGGWAYLRRRHASIA
jgi:LPXTG-motif cell wall-anchored protein